VLLLLLLMVLLLLLLVLFQFCKLPAAASRSIAVCHALTLEQRVRITSIRSGSVIIDTDVTCSSAPAAAAVASILANPNALQLVPTFGINISTSIIIIIIITTTTTSTTIFTITIRHPTLLHRSPPIIRLHPCHNPLLLHRQRLLWLVPAPPPSPPQLQSLNPCCC